MLLFCAWCITYLLTWESNFSVILQKVVCIFEFSALHLNVLQTYFDGLHIDISSLIRNLKEFQSIRVCAHKYALFGKLCKTQIWKIHDAFFTISCYPLFGFPTKKIHENWKIKVVRFDWTAKYSFSSKIFSTIKHKQPWWFQNPYSPLLYETMKASWIY